MPSFQKPLTFFTALCLGSSLTLTVSAQSVPDLKNEVVAALGSGNADKAFDLADTLYKTSKKAKNSSDAGYAAYVKAQIYDMKNKSLDAAKAYEQCGKEYKIASSAAQSLNCRYQSGMAYVSAGKSSTAIDVLKDAVKELEKIGQEKSALAANSYLVLSKISLPSKITNNHNATAKRKSAIAYADKAVTALKATGQDGTETHLSAMFLKAVAFEDLEDYEPARDVYKNILTLAEDNADISGAFIKKVETRYSIAKSRTMKKEDRGFITVRNTSGGDVDLKIKKKRKVRTPRINNNQMVDGASVKARITIDDDGKVIDIHVLESVPHEDFGKAFVEAVETWKFMPPKGVSGSNIEPFMYNMTFSVIRR